MAGALTLNNQPRAGALSSALIVVAVSVSPDPLPPLAVAIILTSAAKRDDIAGGRS